MRIPPDFVASISKSVIDTLNETDLIKVNNKEKAISITKMTIINDLKVEDDLDHEVKELIEQHISKLSTREQENLEYQKMFSMIKKQLVRERGLIL